MAINSAPCRSTAELLYFSPHYYLEIRNRSSAADSSSGIQNQRLNMPSEARNHFSCFIFFLSSTNQLGKSTQSNLSLLRENRTHDLREHNTRYSSRACFLFPHICLIFFVFVNCWIIWSSTDIISLPLCRRSRVERNSGRLLQHWIDLLLQA